MQGSTTRQAPTLHNRLRAWWARLAHAHWTTWTTAALLTLGMGLLVITLALFAGGFLSKQSQIVNLKPFLFESLTGLVLMLVAVMQLIRADLKLPAWPSWSRGAQPTYISMGLMQLYVGILLTTMSLTLFVLNPSSSPFELPLLIGAFTILPVFLLLWWAISRLSRFAWQRLTAPRTIPTRGRHERRRRRAAPAVASAESTIRASTANTTPRISRRTAVIGLGVLSLGVGVIGALIFKLPSLIARYTFIGPSDLVAWSPAGKRVASGGAGGVVEVWDALTGAHLQKFHCAGVGPYDEIVGLTWAPDGQRLIASYYLLESQQGGDVTQMWGMATGKALATLKQPIASASGAWQPRGQNVLVSADDGVHLWDSLTNKSSLLIPNKNDVVAGIAWSLDGRYVVAWVYQVVSIWAAQTGKLAYRYQNSIRQNDDGIAEPLGPNCLAWSPDGQHIAAGCQDNTLLVWDALTGDNVKSYRGPLNDPSDKYAFDGTQVMSIAWSPDSAYVAAGGDDQKVRVWRVAGAGDQRTPTFVWNGHRETVTSVGWSADGSLIASGSSDGSAQVWRPQGDLWG